MADIAKYIDQPLGYTRMDKHPLENNTVFANEDGKSGYARAVEYAKNHATSYPGQTLAAEHDDGTWDLYIVQASKNLKLLISAPQATFTASSIVDNMLYVSGKCPPIGIKSRTTGVYYAVAPDILMQDGEYSGLYRIDLTGFTPEGTWDIISVRQ